MGQQLQGWSKGQFLEGGTGEAIVPQIMKRAQPGQVIPLCLMLTYRANGPYNDALKAYHAIYPHAKDQMQPMIVVTTERDRDAEPPEYFEAEEALIAAGIPISVVFDRDSFWRDRVLAGAPEHIVTDEKAKIIWHDHLHDDHAYWEMLSQTR